MIYHRLKSTGYCEVVGWYDDDYWEYRRCGRDVEPFEKIGDTEYDYVLVAKTNSEEIEKTIKKHELQGIMGKKIIAINTSKFNNFEAFKFELMLSEMPISEGCKADARYFI